MVEMLKGVMLEVAAAAKQLQGAVAGGRGLSQGGFHAGCDEYAREEALRPPVIQDLWDVAGLYDYESPGCRVKDNVLVFLRKHFVLEENMLEVDCPCVTPKSVLKASGHVHKFTDLMVKDEKIGACHRGDHLIKDHCKEKLEKDLSLKPEEVAKFKHVLAVLDDLSAEEMGAKIKQYGITALDTKITLSNQY